MFFLQYEFSILTPSGQTIHDHREYNRSEVLVINFPIFRKSYCGKKPVIGDLFMVLIDKTNGLHSPFVNKHTLVNTIDTPTHNSSGDTERL